MTEQVNNTYQSYAENTTKDETLLDISKNFLKEIPLATIEDKSVNGEKVLDLID